MSLRPLFFFGYLGVVIVLMSLGLGLFIGIEQFLLGDPLQLRFSGAALLGIFVTFLGCVSQINSCCGVPEDRARCVVVVGF